MSKTTTFARTRADGTLVEVMPDGSEVPMPTPGPLPAMTAAEVHAAALADPDAQPWTPEQLAKARRVPRAKTLRRALGLTQEEFAAARLSQGDRWQPRGRAICLRGSASHKTSSALNWRPGRNRFPEMP